MNWAVLQEKYPKSYEEIFEYHKSTGLDGYSCMRNFLSSKGYYTAISWLPSLREYEQKLNEA